MVVFSAIAAIVGAVGAAVGAAAAGLGALGTAAGLGAAGSLGATLGGASLIGGIGASAYGAYGQYKASQQMAAAQRNAEALRKKQMALELNNSAINKIREAQMARATNLVRGTNQIGSGAAFGSALANSTGSVESALGYSLDTAGQAGSIGYGIFNANAQYSDASTSKSIASGISSLGQTILGNVGSIEKVGTYAIGTATGNNFTGIF